MIFSFGTSVADHSVLFVQWAAQNEGVEIGENNAIPIDFIGVCAIRRQQSGRIVLAVMPPGAWTVRFSGVPWKPATPIAATAT